MDGGYSHFKQKLEEVQHYSDENWENMVDIMIYGIKGGMLLLTEIKCTDENYAVDMPDGHWLDLDDCELWVKDGKYHREDGPAIITATGTQLWVQGGKQHRTDGPAVEYANGTKAWHLNDHQLPFNEWLEENDETTDKQKVLLKLKYG